MAQHSLFEPILPQAGAKLAWGNVSGSALSLALSTAARQANVPLLIITPDSLSGQQLEDELSFFLGACPELPVRIFPDRETLPYDLFSPHQDIISERLATLYHLPHLSKGIIIASIQTLMHYLLPREFLAAHSLVMQRGDLLNINELRERLTFAGYHAVSQVMQHGEYAVRGSLFDIFPMGSQTPFRIDLFDNEIESIRIFDPETQLSAEKIEQINLLPAREYPLTDAAITLFRQNWRAQFSGNPLNSPMYQNISQGLNAAGIEYYLPLFYATIHTFFDYLPKNSIICKLQSVQEAAVHFWQEIEKRFEAKNIDHTQPLLQPAKLFLRADEIFAKINRFAQINIYATSIDTKPNKCNFNGEAIPDLSIDRKAKQPFLKLQAYLSKKALDNNQRRILFCCESKGRREVLLELLRTINLKPHSVDNWQSFLQCGDPICITIAALENGFSNQTENITLITETQLFGAQVQQQRRRKQKKPFDADSVVRDLLELNIGTPIVHIDHGIGRYLGLKTLDVGEHKAEYLMLEYANNAKLYVPVAALHLINRYTGSDAEQTPLHHLGSEQWSKVKRKAAERIRDVAAELLELYAIRAAKRGYKFGAPQADFAAFTSSFAFEATPDQEKAIYDVMQDMQSEKIMDRLVCGDVGFGKTEVAMRAAFLAVQANKQVAVLVPTTLLAQQHFQTFCDRFAEWPIKIDVLSRFRTPKEHKGIIADLQQHKIDIIIGTHKLIQKDIQFGNLGLLILDEEHRFGVKQKDKLKALRAEVDILTLTATPIPRTLNMAFVGMRDLSIIATPPARRLSVKTFVQEYNKEIIREAILREVLRGGQVYFLHNSVLSIEHVGRELNALVPEIKIGIAHGQMREKQLEQVMHDFYHHKFNVLLCTTIIESGIDIPTANTIVIDRADKFGLAQLHQLRGRVGRSHHQAYAYLLVASKKALTSDATKRLDAIASLEDLGSGFMLANHDLEIRGAGEFLGEEQSGHMQAIGFSLYMELLERAVKSLKQGKEPELDPNLHHAPEIELKIPALVPEDYIHDIHARLILYKRIANATEQQQLDELQIEMIDRFGLLPPQAKNLFKLTELKLHVAQLGIKKIEAGTTGGYIEFDTGPNIDSEKLVTLIQVHPKEYQFSGPNRIRFTFLDEVTVDGLIDKLYGILKTIEK